MAKEKNAEMVEATNAAQTTQMELPLNETKVDFTPNAKFGKSGKANPVRISVGFLWGEIHLRITDKKGTEFTLVLGMNLLKNLLSRQNED